MRTTVHLPDDLLKQGSHTLTSLIAEGLRMVLAPKAQMNRPRRLPVSSATGGVATGVDLTSNAALQTMMDDDQLLRDGIKLK